MSSDDTVQIRVGKHTVGVLGLKSVLEAVADTFADKPDALIRSELLTRLKNKNYIPDKARETYGDAFLREFKKFLGKPYEEDVVEGLTIKVLGPGCARCDKLEKDVIEAMAELNLAGDIEHVRDVKEIGKFGVMGMPALIINGEIKSVGSTPPKNRIIGWLKDTEG